MKRLFPIIIITSFLIGIFHSIPIKAFDSSSFTDSQFETIGSLGLGHLISDGQITELDFSQGSGDVGFLVALGKSIVTKDPTYILEYGLNWAVNKVQSLINSVYDWFAVNFPDLYEFFTGDKVEIKYHPMPVETRKNFTHLLKNRVGEEDPVVPDPDINYASYLALLNSKSFFTSGFQSDFWFGNYNRQTSTNSGYVSFEGDPNNFSFIRKSWIYFPNYFNDYNHQGAGISNYISGSGNYQMSTCYFSEPITLYFNQSGDNTYILTCSVPDVKKGFYSNGTTYYDGNISYNPNNQSFFIGYGQLQTSQPTIESFLFTGTLEECFKVACINFLNVDIYVNGDLWGKGNFENDDSLIYPIGIPDNFEIFSGVQGAYYYPDPSFWDLQGLVDLIKQAISEYGVISINDIQPLIVDINGQPAVRVTNISRNDYDNLIGEQYFIYPDSEVLQVPSVITDNGDVIKYLASDSGVNLIPDDILLVLCGGGVFLLIAYLINRMLE